MSAHNSHTLKATLFFAVLLLLNTSIAQAVTPPCGTVLTSNTTFDSDMNCPFTAFILDGAGSNNVIVDCAGFTVSVAEGVAVFASNVTGVTINNCNIDTLDSSGFGISGSSMNSSEILNNTITTAGTFAPAISLRQSFNNIIDGNSFSTTGMSSRAMQIENQSSNNIVSNNIVHSALSQGIRLRSGSNNNTFSQNTVSSDSSNALGIQSASDNQFSGNSFSSPLSSVQIGKLSLQNGGLSADDSGNLFAVENNFGGSGGSGGSVTTMIQVDPVTGAAISYLRLVAGGLDLGFGFDALEVLPNGRFLALRGGNSSSLYEINPVSGEVTQIPLVLPVLTGSVNGLQVVDNDTLLAITNRGELLNIDLITSMGTLLGQDGDGWTDLAMHPVSGRLYVTTRWSTEASGTSHLWEINPSTGAIIGEIGDTGTPFLADIDFSPGGVLYGNNWLYQIDENTGTATSIGGFGPDPYEPPSLNNTFDTPECDVQLNQTSFVDGDTVTANVFRFVNLSTTPVAVELKFWLGLPGTPPISIFNVGADGSFVLSAGLDIDLGPGPLLAVTASLPRGGYEIGCRLLDPVTGQLLSEDRNLFYLQ